jgi:hypothetical protein
MNEPYTLKRSTRKCAITDKLLQPGDVYYSVLVENESGIERLEILESAWKSEPENAIGWWKSKVPKLDSGKVYWAPAEVIVSYFERLMNTPDNDEVRYVMSLLLMRKRLAKQVDSMLEENNKTAFDLYVGRLDQTFRVNVVQLSTDKLKLIESELCQYLFTDRPVSQVD